MRYLFPLLLTGCLSASTSHGSLTVRSTVESKEYGTHGEVLLNNVPRAVATHCENIEDCFEQTQKMCGGGFTTIKEQWLISKLQSQGSNQFTYSTYGLYFVLAECK